MSPTCRVVIIPLSTNSFRLHFYFIRPTTTILVV
ncbi:hypothetical protein CORC01_14229 [Colletotrichum orchidophilum]|uniref:Uncharacterized protein n=1 Tax=Colletotrichum orchidophilum TaxID=1209926 RepID=A0A1G4AMR2_9PEZI|nr:uncharacterized protein CORC01_14229 [Colletotrichum orchidophilum]OHE90478.1 hypothetical protein CORC01_14229 [Colletotrichum orchidophilum]